MMPEGLRKYERLIVYAFPPAPGKGMPKLGTTPDGKPWGSWAVEKMSGCRAVGRYVLGSLIWDPRP